MVLALAMLLLYWLIGKRILYNTIADALSMQVNRVQNVNGKGAVIPHVPVKGGSSRGPVTLLYMESQA